MNTAAGSMSEVLDYSTCVAPQWDIIQARYQQTSNLLHGVFGMSTKGLLSDKLARSGLGRVNFSDLILALAGMAIHTWVFQSPFPKCLTRPERSIRLLEELLDEKGK